MSSQIRLGRIFGIEIWLHRNWILLAALIVLSLWSQYRSAHQEWSSSFVLTLAIVTAVLVFASLLLHELSHSLVAKAYGMPMKEITFFALGAFTRIGKQPACAKTEFWIAFAGPLTSGAIASICMASATLAGSTVSAAATMFSRLGYINLALAGFNLLPGFALDGGRILRAIIWWKTGDADRSARVAARAGQAVAVLFIVAGLADYLAGGRFNGLWLTFIGLFLFHAARKSARQAALCRSLEKVRVAGVMRPPQEIHAVRPDDRSKTRYI